LREVAAGSIDLPVLPVVVVALAVAGLLVAERRGWRAGIWATKPLAAVGFVAAAVGWGALETTYGRIVLGGLLLSLAGDVLLIPRSATVFRAGIASFLLAHVAYGVAFLARGVAPAAGGAALAAAALPLALVFRWLAPHVEPAMRPAVYAYMAVITMMVASAGGMVAAGGPPIALAGAIAFYLSDLSVARDRFVVESFANRAWGLPLYFGAQLLIAASV
jgi:uncharacterized membrane protein YhhN